MSVLDLTDKIAVITGGSGALGSAISLGLARAGAKVIILSRNIDKSQPLVETIQNQGGEAKALACDVLEKNELQNIYTHIADNYDRVDILINAAGGNHPSATVVPDQKSFFDLPEEAIHWVFNLNLMGTILACQVFGQAMVQSGEGAILNVSSMASLRSITRVFAYGSAKAGINMFTQWLAVYMATQYSPNIRVNALAPGFFVGEQNRFLLFDEATGELSPRGKQIIDHTPMGRFGDPEDLVGTVLWLVSDASRFVTGIVVPVDGGFSAYSGV
jgi:NAD(P)-dependent dehydrogenase (short-subunit alcohol dehydrogenase family)